MSAGISRVLVPLGRTKQYPTALSGSTSSIRRAPACRPRGVVGISPPPAPDATGDPTKLSPEAEVELRGDTGAPRPNSKPATAPEARQKPNWVVPEALNPPKAEDPRVPAAASQAASGERSCVSKSTKNCEEKLWHVNNSLEISWLENDRKFMVGTNSRAGRHQTSIFPIQRVPRGWGRAKEANYDQASLGGNGGRIGKKERNREKEVDVQD